MIRTLTLAALAAVLSTNARAQDSSTVPIGDEYFAMKAYSEGLAEVAKSRLAVEKATESGVKEFAEKMVKEHTECNNKLVELARAKRIPLPTAIDAVNSVAIARLSKLSGADFDKAYLMAQICAHEDALHLYGHESHKGKDSELKELAHKTMSSLWSHTKSAFELAGEKSEFEKLHKIHEYAMKVMAEK